MAGTRFPSGAAGICGARHGLIALTLGFLLAATACASGSGAPAEPTDPPEPTSSPEATGSPEPSPSPELVLPEAVVASIQLDGDPSGVVVVGDKVFVADDRAQRVWYLSLDAELLGQVNLGTEGDAPEYPPFVPKDVRLYAAGGSVFVLEGFADDEVLRLDAESGGVLARTEVDTALGATATDDSIWVGSFDPYEVLRIDLRKGRVVARIPSEGPTGLGAGFGYVWVLNHRAGTVSPVDPETNEVIRDIPVDAPYPERLGVGEGAVWVSSPASDTILRIDPDKMKVVETITVSTEPQDFAFGAGAVWVGITEGIARIDPETNEVTGALELAPKASIWAPFGFDGDGYLWVASSDLGYVFKIDPAKV